MAKINRLADEKVNEKMWGDLKLWIAGTSFQKKKKERKDNALMKQGRKFTARRKTIGEKEEVKKGKMWATRDSERGEKKVSAARSTGERKWGKKQKDEKENALFMNKWQRRWLYIQGHFLCLSLSLCLQLKHTLRRTCTFKLESRSRSLFFFFFTLYIELIYVWSCVAQTPHLSLFNSLWLYASSFLYLSLKVVSVIMCLILFLANAQTTCCFQSLTI